MVKYREFIDFVYTHSILHVSTIERCAGRSISEIPPTELTPTHDKLTRTRFEHRTENSTTNQSDPIQNNFFEKLVRPQPYQKKCF